MLITYKAFLSLFPLLLLGFSAVGFVLRDQRARDDWVRAISSTVPGLERLIGENIAKLADASAVAGIAGLFTLAWTGSGVVRAAGAALSRVFDVPEYTGPSRHLWALGSLAGLGLLGLVSVGAGAAITGLAGGALWAQAISWLLWVVLDFLFFAVAYRALTQRRGPQLRSLWAGALVAAVGWTIVKAISVWYVQRTVAGAEAVYGAFAATVGLLVMLSLGSKLFVYGAVVNAILFERGLDVGEMKAINLARHRALRARAGG